MATVLVAGDDDDNDDHDDADCDGDIMVMTMPVTIMVIVVSICSILQHGAIDTLSAGSAGPDDTLCLRRL